MAAAPFSVWKSVQHHSQFYTWAHLLFSQIKVVFLGASSVGKTALVCRIVSGHFPFRYTPTVEDHYQTFLNLKGKRQLVDLVDTSGSNSFAAVVNYQIVFGDVFVVVYSVNSRTSFDKAKQILKDICSIKSGSATNGAGAAKPVPILLVGTQAEELGENTRQVSYEEGCALARSYWQTEVLETSALHNIKVELIMVRVAERLSGDKKRSIARRLSRKASNAWRRASMTW